MVLNLILNLFFKRIFIYGFSKNEIRTSQKKNTEFIKIDTTHEFHESKWFITFRIYISLLNISGFLPAAISQIRLKINVAIFRFISDVRAYNSFEYEFHIKSHLTNTYTKSGQIKLYCIYSDRALMAITLMWVFWVL